MKKELSPALRKLIDSYRQALPDKLAELQILHASAAEDGDDDRLRAYYTAVHKLAGSSGSYGFPELSNTARVLDRYLSDILAGEASWDEDHAAELLRATRQQVDQLQD